MCSGRRFSERLQSYLNQKYLFNVARWETPPSPAPPNALQILSSKEMGMQLIGPAISGWTYALIPDFPALVPSLLGSCLASSGPLPLLFAALSRQEGPQVSEEFAGGICHNSDKAVHHTDVTQMACSIDHLHAIQPGFRPICNLWSGSPVADFWASRWRIEHVWEASGFFTRPLRRLEYLLLLVGVAQIDQKNLVVDALPSLWVCLGSYFPSCCPSALLSWQPTWRICLRLQHLLTISSKRCLHKQCCGPDRSCHCQWFCCDGGHSGQGNCPHCNVYYFCMVDQYFRPGGSWTRVLHSGAWDWLRCNLICWTKRLQRQFRSVPCSLSISFQFNMFQASQSQHLFYVYYMHNVYRDLYL